MKNNCNIVSLICVYFNFFIIMSVDRVYSEIDYSSFDWLNQFVSLQTIAIPKTWASFGVLFFWNQFVLPYTPQNARFIMVNFKKQCLEISSSSEFFY